MMEWLHPGLIYILGVPLIPLLRGKVKQAYLLLLPLLAFTVLLLMSKGVFLSEGRIWSLPFLGHQLVLGRVDKLSIVFAYVFVIASFCMMLYALHIREDGQHIAAYLYVGSTLGVVFAGDLITLFFFWEVMAWSALFLVWYRKTKRSYEAGFRYILVHLFGGACLLGGILLHVKTTGSIEFQAFRFGWGLDWNNLASYLILLAFLVNAAVPPLHAWLADAYPEATVTGAVFLTAFTTKSAIYVLIRGFPGVELLTWLGAIMAVYGVVFAVLENDIRRLLAYHIISQVGYMVSGVGMGVFGTPAGEMGINGATAHAFCHILYKALLFMGAGAVLHVTGRSKLTELGGLYRFMPITFYLYMVGAFSISGFPLFNGFISKTMVVESSAMWHSSIVWLMLEGASVGTFLHTGLKLPWGTWFGKGQPACEAKEPPKNMLAAMGLTAVLCTFVGVYPRILYDLLPYPVQYHPYTPAHVVSMSQLLLFTFVAFWLFKGMLQGESTLTIDTDWFYRMAGRKVIWFCEKPLMTFAQFVDGKVMGVADFLVWFSRNPALALNIKKEEAKLKVKRFMMRRERAEVHAQALAEKRRKYPGELPRLTLGASLFLILLSFALYLILYLVY
ncbi:MAG: Na(+)/H(+) antiporter subunit D [Deltaproteobacteria bacterium RBG_13_53_10]|nr:MAG: Na(+)/H(+) antiporter subunit D [Deltaproteobacteria bacterium RBG_13_53_10]